MASKSRSSSTLIAVVRPAPDGPVTSTSGGWGAMALTEFWLSFGVNCSTFQVLNQGCRKVIAIHAVQSWQRNVEYLPL